MPALHLCDTTDSFSYNVCVLCYVYVSRLLCFEQTVVCAARARVRHSVECRACVPRRCGTHVSSQRFTCLSETRGCLVCVDCAAGLFPWFVFEIPYRVGIWSDCQQNVRVTV
jgi:hypothetical protein